MEKLKTIGLGVGALVLSYVIFVSINSEKLRCDFDKKECVHLTNENYMPTMQVKKTYNISNFSKPEYYADSKRERASNGKLFTRNIYSIRFSSSNGYTHLPFHLISGTEKLDDKGIDNVKKTVEEFKKFTKGEGPKVYTLRQNVSVFWRMFWGIITALAGIFLIYGELKKK